MSAQLLSSKTVTQEEEPEIRSIEGVATGVLACVGITRKGPVGVSTLITGFPQFVKIFGSDTGSGFATNAVRAFFAEGGQRMYFTRVVHYTDITSAATKTSAAGTLNLLTAAAAASSGTVLGASIGPFALVHGDTIIVDPNALGPLTATISATRATRTAANAPPYALTNGMILTVKIDGGAVQSVSFLTAEFVSIGAATAAEVAAVLNAKLNGAFADVSGGNPRINSDTLGTGSHVEVTGGTANAILGFATAVVDGTGNVVDVSAITVAELKTIIEAAVAGVTVSNDAGAVRITSNTTGPGSSVQVTAPSTADDELGFDNAVHSGGTGAAAATLQVDAAYDGTYADEVEILIAAATSGVAAEFNLQVLFEGTVRETFPNLTMDDAADRYVETILNAVDTGSAYVAVTDLDVNPASPSSERPANSPGTPAVAFGPLVGGDDGLVGIADVDFTGDPTDRLGFYSFDLNADVDLLDCPDRATAAAHNAMISYCSVWRNGKVFPILDVPASLSESQVVTYVETTAALEGLSEHGYIAWPRVKVLNPNASVFGSASTITVPNSGHIAGMFARNDSRRVGGIYDPPGGTEIGVLKTVIGLENENVNDERVRDIIVPHGINPICKLPRKPICVNDVVLLKKDGPFPTVAERRGVIFIEKSIEDGTQFARLRNNDESLRDEIDRTCTGFLTQQMKLGAFRSKDPAKAFFVDVGDALNPPSEQFAFKVNTRIGLATVKPARFLIFSFSQDTRELDAELEQS